MTYKEVFDISVSEQKRKENKYNKNWKKKEINSKYRKEKIFNFKKLYIKNAAPEIMNILAITGLNRSFSNFDDQYKTPAKRQRSF